MPRLSPRYESVKSLLVLLVLALLQAEPKGGYDVIAEIHKRFNILLSPGTIYPLLDSLEDDGFIEHFEASQKRIYKVTRAGSELLKNLFDECDKLLRTIGLLYSSSTEPPAEVSH